MREQRELDECRVDLNKNKYDSDSQESPLKGSPSGESNPEESPQEESEEGSSNPEKLPEDIPEDIEGENELSESPGTKKSPYKSVEKNTDDYKNSRKVETKSWNKNEKNPSQVSDPEKIMTLCEELQDIKKELGYNEPVQVPQRKPYGKTPKFEVLVEPRNGAKKTKSLAKKSTLDTALLRSVGRWGYTIERITRITRRIPIDKEDTDWELVKKGIAKFKRPKTPKKVNNKKPCFNCIRLLSSGLTTEHCKMHKNHK